MQNKNVLQLKLKQLFVPSNQNRINTTQTSWKEGATIQLQMLQHSTSQQQTLQRKLCYDPFLQSSATIVSIVTERHGYHTTKLPQPRD